MPRKQKKVNPKALEREWLSQVGTLTGTKLRKLKDNMDQYEVESAQALRLIESFGAFRDTEVSVDDEVYTGDRCDDAPVTRLVRVREFEVRMMLQDLKIQEQDGRLKPKDVQQLKQLAKRQAKAVADIKKASQQYKTDIRSLSTDEDQALKTHKEAIDEVVQALSGVKADALALINESLRARGKNGHTAENYVATIMPGQAEIWKNRWLETSKVVNKIVGEEWAKAERSIRDEAVSAGASPNAHNEPWQLDYIGSLAKGVKGPPKQHIAFDPDKFDVDANLDAPSLSSWAVGNGSVADRDRLWGRKDGNLKDIKALQRFQNAVHQALSKIPGYDADDPFEVVVTADVTIDDETYEVVKEQIIALKKMAPATRFTNFLRDHPDARDMLDDDDVPLPSMAADLLGELGLYASRNGFSL